MSGENWIDPGGSNDPFTVMCDMETDGGEITIGGNENVDVPSVMDGNLRCNSFLLYFFSCCWRPSVSNRRIVKLFFDVFGLTSEYTKPYMIG